MSMFGFLGFGNVASATGGAAVGAGITHLVHHFTTGKKLKTLNERLGDTPVEMQERVIRKVAILKTLAHKDGDFSLSEQVFLYRYILASPDLPADIKVDLALELDAPLPALFGGIREKLRQLINFNDLFRTEEEAAGFVTVMFALIGVDGVLRAEEIAYIKQVCSDCKIPPKLLASKLPVNSN